MAIEIRQAGLGKLYGEAARLAGQAQAAERAVERAQVEQTQLRQEQLRRDLAELEHQWNIEAYNRSKAWELEKMEMASRHDFELQERKRVERQSETDTAIREIDRRVQAGELSPEEAQKLKTMVTMRQAGVAVPPTFWRQQEEDEFTQLAKMFGMGEETTTALSTAPVTTTPATREAVIARAKEIYSANPDMNPTDAMTQARLELQTPKEGGLISKAKYLSPAYIGKRAVGAVASYEPIRDYINRLVESYQRSKMKPEKRREYAKARGLPYGATGTW